MAYGVGQVLAIGYLLFWFSHFGRCVPHGFGAHPSLRGKRDRFGQFLSPKTAKFPEPLANDYAAAALPLFSCSSSSEDLFLADAFLGKPSPPPPSQPTKNEQPRPRANVLQRRHGLGWDRRLAVSAPGRPRHDGATEETPPGDGGLPGCATPLGGSFRQVVRKPYFTDGEILDIRQAISEFCRASGQPFDPLVASGQPFSLVLLESLRVIGGFPDPALLPSLTSGVATGVLAPLEPSGRWPPSKAGPVLGPCLDWCDGNWQSATTNSDSLRRLIQAEVDSGFVAVWDGSEEDARAAWPTGIAKGKLGIAQALGREDRLILDTTISGVNPLAVIPEKTSVPGPYDSRHHVQEHPDDTFVALTLDASKAHKRVRRSRPDQGLMLFAFEEVLTLSSLPFRWRPFPTSGGNGSLH